MNKADALLPEYILQDRYQIETILGGDEFGITYSAKDIRLKRNVIIKEYFISHLVARHANHIDVIPRRIRDENLTTIYNNGLNKFFDEAQSVVSIVHPNITCILDYFGERNPEHLSRGYIIMRNEGDHTLEDRLKETHTISENSIRYYMTYILRALEYIHKNNIIHHAIRPASITISLLDEERPRPILTDFGAARTMVALMNEELTNAINTAYSPIEQYAAYANDQGTWTDIYALGALLYQCVSGKLPITAIERKKEAKDPYIPAKESADSKHHYSESLLETIDQCLRLEPKNRIQNISDLRKSLRLKL